MMPTPGQRILTQFTYTQQCKGRKIQQTWVTDLQITVLRQSSIISMPPILEKTSVIWPIPKAKGAWYHYSSLSLASSQLTQILAFPAVIMHTKTWSSYSITSSTRAVMWTNNLSFQNLIRAISTLLSRPRRKIHNIHSGQNSGTWICLCIMSLTTATRSAMREYWIYVQTLSLKIRVTYATLCISIAEGRHHPLDFPICRHLNWETQSRLGTWWVWQKTIWSSLIARHLLRD